ncbi:GyrI-like domain-containing protein [Chitinophaga sp. Cy-1792]|uniref:AraC family transcriptional regulator n=1 Tax=Chitinophaga sp. Cy-1792 TaxID=2608339 RepID=UPI001423C5BA|nr:AraC family transcriptional regulator [Chitinophaga sp. Cy-1792]NIG55836.1 AraC family transcriptional regulator [Chitinophaga sp. Cy-1792]
MDENRSVNLECVYNVLHLIEQHYDQDISIKQLEAVSHYSYRNIQRIFKYTCNETIGAYQKRIRLENAYKLMLYTKDSITDIAFKVGFESLASFSKAFKECFHCSPKEAKLSKTLLFSDAGIQPVESESSLQPEIIYFPPVKVCYESAFLPYEYTMIEQLWERFLENEFPVSTAYYGIIADEPLITSELKCRYDACATEQPPNRILPSKMILGGRYAQFIHKGSYETIEETYKNIYAGWILESDLEFGHTSIIEHYIRHPDNTEAIEDQLTGILLPLR